MKRDTIIFDLDGTLLNSLADICESFNYALNICGYGNYTQQEVRGFVGSGIKRAFERALGEEVEEEAINELVEIFKGHYIRHLYELTAPYEGIIELLEELKRKKYSMAIVSNKIDDAVKELNNRFFGKYIDIAIGEGGNIGRKPCADGIFKALGKLGKGLENVIYVGDSEIDIQTAKNANIPCISVLWGFKSKEFLSEHGAEVFAQKPKDILYILENNKYKLQ